MFRRSFLTLSVLGLAVGGPYALFDPGMRERFAQLMKPAADESAETDKGNAAIGTPRITPTQVAPHASHPPAANASNPPPASLEPRAYGTEPGAELPPITGIPLTHLGEILRFDIDHRWVMSRWGRVATVPSGNLLGLRVSVVTGTEIDDLTGVMTYYFDDRQVLQRISFYGRTGDDRKLVGLLTQYYALKPEPNLAAGLYLTRWNGRAVSVLQIQYAPVIMADAPHSRLDVAMELNRPSNAFGLSEEFQTRLGGQTKLHR